MGKKEVKVAQSGQWLAVVDQICGTVHTKDILCTSKNALGILVLVRRNE
jgi:hypothetical protein